MDNKLCSICTMEYNNKIECIAEKKKNLGECHKHVEEKKAETKGILYCSIYVKFQSWHKQIYVDKKQITVFLR